MKKLLLTLIVSIAFCGSILAQTPSEIWPGFDYHDYPSHQELCGAVIIDGEYITVDYEGWDQLEIVAFVGEEPNEQIRSFAMYLNDEFVVDFGDPYPVTWMEPIYYETPGEPVHFKMYDHSRGITYTQCVTIQDGEEFVYLSGDDHTEALDEDYSHEVFLSFTSPAGITKEIEPYTPDGGWYLIASPVGTVTFDKVNNLLSNTYDLYYFNQVGDAEGKEWINQKANLEDFVNLEAGKGYLYANSGEGGEATILTFYGDAYNGEGVFPLDYLEGGEPGYKGLNLVGNPYNAVATVDLPFYVMVNGSELITAAEAEVDVVQPMEGIIVEATGTDQFVTFTPNRNGGNKVARLALNLSNSRGLIDRAVVNFGQNRQLHKFQLNSNHTKVYIPVDGQDYAVVSSEGMGEMPVNFMAEHSGSYTLSFNAQMVNFNYLHLIDNLTGKDVDLLANPSYSFDANITDYASRFKLVFVTSDSDSNDNFAFFSNGSFIINNEGAATLQVVDVTGRILSTETIEGCANVNVNAAPGVYMIRLINGENVRVQKVVVR